MWTIVTRETTKESTESYGRSVTKKKGFEFVTFVTQLFHQIETRMSRMCLQEEKFFCSSLHSNLHFVVSLLPLHSLVVAPFQP